MTLSIRTKVILIIFAIIAGMTTASVVVGISLTNRNLIKTIENDMSVSGTIAEQLVAEKVAHIRSVMRLTAEKCRGLDDAQTREVLLQVAAGEGYLDIGLIDRNGKVLSYGIKPPDYDLSKNINARRALNGETVVSTTQFNNHGDFIMRFWLPLEEGGTMVASLPGTVISDILSEFRIWKTGNIFALDHEGVIIADMDSSLVYKRLSYIGETGNEALNIANVATRMARGETGVDKYSYNGVPRVCAFRPIAGTDGWSLGVVAPINESPVSQTKNIFLLSGAVFLGLGILIAFLAAGSIAHPFEKVKELALVAESASEAKSHFLANMSHEMRTPLNAIIGFSELELGKERNGEIKPETWESLEKIYSSGVTLLGLINDILDISKIESGKFELVPVNYDMPSLINDTVVLNIVRIGSKPIVFKLDIDEKLPARLFGDELRIKQILNNLLSNAFKYTKEGEVILKIRCEQDGEGVWMTYDISDTGMGIRQEDIDKLFGEYNQVDTRSNRHIEGTGLGLAITKQLVEMMGGAIYVKSEYGKGTTFKVRLLQGFVNNDVIGRKLANNLQEFRYTMARQDRNKRIVRRHIPYARVLVVDDVATNLDLARGIMKPYGMTVDCVNSGAAAISQIRSGEPKYNAIFMDHMMPGMDGIEAVRIIRNEIDSDYARTVPIIALTANAIIGNDEMFLNNGFQDFLTKPIDIMKMNEAIDRWVRDKKLEKELGLTNKEDLPEEGPAPLEDGGTSLKIAESQDTMAEAALGEEELQRLREVETNLRVADILRAAALEGLDWKNGLERFGGDGKSYTESLRSYAVHTPALLDSIRTIEALENYAITVHGIKGSSYGISADAIGQKAERLEHAAKAGNFVLVKAENGELITMVEKFIIRLNDLLDTLNLLLQKPLRAAPDRALLEKILGAVENYEMGELDQALSELEQYSYETEADLVSWLRDQIDQSEFESVKLRLMSLGRDDDPHQVFGMPIGA
ncbi:MAG: response regulator [Treponema sp.]|jgi:signal transduction histidine kinase/CheY-like chemotaxis protein/HPt (histidine-containing phosphotransfer) domain-containing protein|nr:response regulator [Treponema sp.]